MGNSSPSSFEEMQKLPLAIREADAEYQLHRLILFRQLLQVKRLPISTPLF